ncbi:helix-turn-helix domain-containing protein [Gluconobacter cadivus]|uniref:Uncharacterized protein n=1 Tax=Gluconobacter cadivus TaxID=2728101 RepID=A0ABR9YYJ5_9PROT|nr:hypothetical protein [Gluconobacter cadivus]MBF0889636.1 hypothetical protein [Gluconobacter cadivus]
MSDMLDPFQFLSELNKDIAAAGGQSRFAEQRGVSHTTVSHVRHSRRDPSKEFLAAIGFDRFPRYRPLRGGIHAPLLTSMQFFTEVNNQIRQAGGLTSFCTRHRLPIGSVSNYLNDNRRASDALLQAVGYARLTRFRRRVVGSVSA